MALVRVEKLLCQLKESAEHNVKNCQTAGNDLHIYNKENFPFQIPIQTRWNDNDMYGHVNNMVYYSYFDTIVNKYLQEKCMIKQERSCIGLVVHSACNYYSSLSFPETIVAGLRVKKLGKSSVTYEIGIFDDKGASPSAVGEFVHVFVDRQTRRPIPIPSQIREGLSAIA